MTIERRLIDSLTPYEDNPRTHTQEQIDKLAVLMKKYGFHDSHAIAIDEDGIVIWGHGRIEAARKAGLEDVPVEVLPGLSESDKSALRIADNGIAEQSKWDLSLLAKEMEELEKDGYNLEFLALDESLLDELAGVFDSEKSGEAGDADAPDDFNEYDEDIETEHECPKCGYKWSGGS